MTKKIVDRQFPLVALFEVGIDNIGTGNGVDVSLPPGAVLLDIKVQTVVAFDGTTNTLTISDGTTTFANAVDVTSTGAETVSNLAKEYPEGGVLHTTMAQTGTATTGRAIVAMTYVQLGHGDRVYAS